MVFPHLFGMQEDDIDAPSLHRLQADQSTMRSTPNQSSLQNPFSQLTHGQQGSSLLPQSMLQQQQQQHSNSSMMHMVGSQSQQQFGSNSFPQASGISSSSAGNSLFDRFGGLSSHQFTESQSQQQQQQQSTAASLLSGNSSFFDGFSQAQGSGGIQPNLRQLEMANDLLAAQRRLSLGLGTTAGAGAMSSSSALQQQLNSMSGGGSGSFGAVGSGIFNDFASGKNSNQALSLAAAAGLDHFQSPDTSNLEGLMASQLQQQQQNQQQNQQPQLSLQQQLMMAAAQQQERRSSFGGAAMGGVDSALGMQLSMLGQQQPITGLDMPNSQHHFSQFQQHQQEQPDNEQEQQNQDSHDETESMGADGMSEKVHRISSGPDESKKPPRKKKAKTFPEKLMQAISSHGEEDAVAWLPDGKSFVIVNDDLFVDQVLNQVFKESKYSSFVRKLHRWGFVRLTSGTGTDCFHHPLFQRGRRDLASKITCTPRDKDGNLKTPHRNMKPPSLAGVERFIRQKADAAVAMAEAKARHRESDPGDSVPLRSTSGMPGSQGQLLLEGMDKSPEPLGIGDQTMTSIPSGSGDMRREMVKSIGLGSDNQAHSSFHAAMSSGERADV